MTIISCCDIVATRASKRCIHLREPNDVMSRSPMKIALLLPCLLLVACDQPPPPPQPHYQMISDGNGGAWVLDATYGEVKHCVASAPTATGPACHTVPAVKPEMKK